MKFTYEKEYDNVFDELVDRGCYEQATNEEELNLCRFFDNKKSPHPKKGRRLVIPPIFIYFSQNRPLRVLTYSNSVTGVPV